MAFDHETCSRCGERAEFTLTADRPKSFKTASLPQFPLATPTVTTPQNHVSATSVDTIPT